MVSFKILLVLFGIEMSGMIVGNCAIRTCKTDINAIDEDGRTLLHKIIMNKDLDKFKGIISNPRLDVNIPDANGYMPLHWAAEIGNDSIVTKLIKVGAKVDPINKYGDTPLHKAVVFDHTSTAVILINAEANVQKADNEGNTALHFASYQGNAVLVKLLIEKGANPLAINNKGETPLDFAEAKGHKTVVKMLQ